MVQIILFDGDCNFCDKSVQFIIKRDPKGFYKFASLQSEIGQKLIKQHNIPANLDSFILVTDEKWYAKSSAALHVCKKIGRASCRERVRYVMERETGKT